MQQADELLPDKLVMETPSMLSCQDRHNFPVTDRRSSTKPPIFYDIIGQKGREIHVWQHHLTRRGDIHVRSVHAPVSFVTKDNQTSRDGTFHDKLSKKRDDTTTVHGSDDQVDDTLTEEDRQEQPSSLEVG
jgi:hypothetical protein